LRVPFFNLLFAILVLSAIWGFGVNINTLGNRIILASEIIPGTTNPSDEAGLKTGDYIIEIKGKETKFFGEIQEIIATHPGEELPIQVERDDRIISLSVRPLMEKSSGAGKIGVYSWIDPIIEHVAEGSPAEIAGLKSGDKILKVNGIELRNTMDLYKILEDKPAVLALELLRGNQTLQFRSSQFITRLEPRTWALLGWL